MNPGWTKVSLGEISRITIGRTPSRENREFWGSGYPWLAIRDIVGGSVVDRTKEQVTEMAATKAAGRLVPSGTVVMSFKLSIGRVAITGRSMFTNEAIAAFENFREGPRFHPGYLMHYLRCLDLADGANRAAMGGTLNKKSLAQIPVMLPPLDEQRRIAAVLDHVDALRSKRRASLSVSGDLPSAIFGSLASGSPVRLGDLVRFYSGGTPSKKEPRFWSGDIPWFSAKDMKRRRLSNSIDHVSSAVFEETNLKMLDAGTIVMVVRGMILAHTVPISVLEVPAAINQDLKALIPREDVNATYLDAALRAQHGVILSKVAYAAHGTGRLETRQLENIRIPVPSRAEQSRVAEVLRAAERTRSQAERNLYELDGLFASLQSRAFSGDLDVSRVVLPSS